MAAAPDHLPGEYYDPFGAHLDDPYSFFREARLNRPVFYSSVFRAWVVTRYQDVRHVLTHPTVFSSANAVRPISAAFAPECQAELDRGYPFTAYVLNTDGGTHRRLRAPLTRNLELKRVRRLEPFIRGQVNALIDAMLTAGTAEFMHDFALPLPFRIIIHLLGIDESDHQAVRTGSAAAPHLFRGSGLSPQEQLAYARQLISFQRLLASYIRARRAQPRDDMISMVVAAAAPGSEPLTFEQERKLVWSLAGVIGAGSWTMASILGTGVYHLLADPRRWEMLVTRPGMVGRTIEEICRYDPPAQTFRRITTQPVTIGGVDLPADTEVVVILGSANRDEALVDRPDDFDIARPRSRHLSFGQGPHICVGAPLARAEMRIVLEALTHRLPGLRLASGHQVRMAPELNHRYPMELHVTW